MENRTKDEVIYVRADRRLKDRFEKQKDESDTEVCRFYKLFTDVNEGKRGMGDVKGNKRVVERGDA